MEITHDDYQVRFDEEISTIICEGSFRLRGTQEYQPILSILLGAVDAKPERLTLDVRELQFLNSSGITMLSKFILQVRKHGASQVLILGSKNYPWQGKSLKNFQRLLPALEMEIG
ncbi:MAG: hypothetical protein COA99_15870 [Moraxellaceae bacterium]|nr:MAG: hypothetical protein COA99_15870 [Moraxellaceae bacterium]